MMQMHSIVGTHAVEHTHTHARTHFTTDPTYGAIAVQANWVPHLKQGRLGKCSYVRSTPIRLRAGGSTRSRVGATSTSTVQDAGETRDAVCIIRGRPKLEVSLALHAGNHTAEVLNNRATMTDAMGEAAGVEVVQEAGLGRD